MWSSGNLFPREKITRRKDTRTARILRHIYYEVWRRWRVWGIEPCDDISILFAVSHVSHNTKAMTESRFVLHTAGMEWAALQYQGRKWMTYTLTRAFFLTASWDNCFETITRCAAGSFNNLAFGVCWLEKYIFVRHDGRESRAMAERLMHVCYCDNWNSGRVVSAAICTNDVLENITSKLIPPGMNLILKSWI